MKLTQDELIQKYELFLNYAMLDDFGRERDVEPDRVSIPIFIAREILKLAKRAPRKRGGQPKSTRQKLSDKMIVDRARRRAESLWSEAKQNGRGISRDKAKRLAATELAQKSILSETEIRDRMDRKKPRKKQVSNRQVGTRGAGVKSAN